MKRLVISAVLAFSIISGCNCDYSTGSRVGVVTKFSKKGLLCSTWEGEMVMGGMRAGTDGDGNATLGANVWTFTVAADREDIRVQVDAALESGKPVIIQYQQVALPTPCTTDSGYFVKSVTEREQ